MADCDVPYVIGDIDFTKGSIALSGKEKFDLMREWPESPFHEYRCTKEGNHFVIAKRHKKISCAAEGCNSWANASCGHKMCKKCRMKKQQASQKLSACKYKGHRLPVTDLAVTSEKEGDGK